MVSASRIACVLLLSLALIGSSEARSKNRVGLNAKAAATENSATSGTPQAADADKAALQGGVPFGSVDTSQVKSDAQNRVSTAKNQGTTISKNELQTRTGATPTNSDTMTSSLPSISLPSKIARPRTYRSGASSAAPVGLVLAAGLAGVLLLL